MKRIYWLSLLLVLVTMVKPYIEGRLIGLSIEKVVYSTGSGWIAESTTHPGFPPRSLSGTSYHSVAWDLNSTNAVDVTIHIDLKTAGLLIPDAVAAINIVTDAPGIQSLNLPVAEQIIFRVENNSSDPTDRVQVERLVFTES